MSTLPVITSSYSLGTVTDAADTVARMGGFSGGGEGNYTNDYFDTTTSLYLYGFSSSTNVSGITGLTDAQMMNQANFATGANGFNFYNTSLSSAANSSAANGGNIWVMAGYPQLVMENTSTITNAVQLQLVEVNPTATYNITANINLASTQEWNGGAGFTPIGNATIPFSGTLQGANNTTYLLNNLYINQPSSTNVGLIGYANGATINYIGLTNETVVGGNYTGGLVGYTGAGASTSMNYDFTNATVTGAEAVGGLVGAISGTAAITNSYSNSTVTATGDAGGLVGSDLNGSIQTSYSGGTVSGSSSGVYSVGGLVGIINSTSPTIQNDYSTANVIALDTSAYIGGFAGYNKAAVSAAYSSGTITVPNGTTQIGGFLGYNTNASVTNVFWDQVNANYSAVGPTSTAISATALTSVTQALNSATYTTSSLLFGDNDWVMINGDTRPLLAMEESTTIDNAHQLQLIDLNSTTLSETYTIGTSINLSGTSNVSDVWDTSTTNGGAGFVPIGNTTTPFTGTVTGSNSSPISNLYIYQPNAPTVSLPNNGSFIGLFGDVTGATINNVGVINANVTGVGYVGLLIGNANSGSFNNDYSTGSLVASDTGASGGDARDYGGLIGEMSGGTLSNSYSSAAITGTGNYNFGGLVGEYGGGNTVSIQNSYANGSMNVTLNGSIGGLVGAADIGGGTGLANIVNSYSAEAITASGATAGGLIGFGNSTYVANSFWDTSISGVTTSVGSTNSAGYEGMTTAQMMTLSNFQAGSAFLSTNDSGTPWSITSTSSTTGTAPTNTWFMFGGTGSGTMPMLMSGYSTTITNVTQLQLAGTTLGANYTLGNNINASATSGGATTVGNVWASTGFVPIGNSITPFTGTFNGQGYTIGGTNNTTVGLYINTSSSNQGLFGDIGSTGVVSNLGLLIPEISVSGSGGNVGALAGINAGTLISDYVIGNSAVSGSGIFGTGSNLNIGGLVGSNSGYITSSYNTGNVNAVNSGFDGGLVGASTAGLITDSYSTGAVASTGTAGDLGGFIGEITGGTISNSYSTGQVSAQSNIGGFVGLVNGSSAMIQSSYSTGNVVATTGSSTYGGFVGYNELGTITNSYSTGNIITSGTDIRLGGFDGSNGGTISYSYSTGAIIGTVSTLYGGFSGDAGGTFSSDFFNTTTSGLTNSQAANDASNTYITGTTFGNSSSGLSALSTYTGSTPWSIGSTYNSANVWGIIPGSSYPYLTAFYTQAPVAISGTTNLATGTTVTLADNGTTASGTNALGGTVSGTTSADNGFFYFLEPSNAITSSSNLLIYASSGTSYANTVTIAPASNGSLTGETLTIGVLQIGDGNSNTISNTESLQCLRWCYPTRLGPIFCILCLELI